MVGTGGQSQGAKHGWPPAEGRAAATARLSCCVSSQRYGGDGSNTAT